MKILHTADWHIGQQFHKRKRYGEFEQFLAWLVDKIKRECFEVLLVAGDIFDTSTPSNRAQELYNNFIADIAKTDCRHVVVTGGNHDSPSLLNAQRNIFKLLKIHVVGSAELSPKDEVLLLHDPQGKPELIVCAVPYLRDRDIRKSEAGESIEAKGKNLMEGIRRHYAEVCQEAEKLQKEQPHWVPIIAMGHLFAAGGSTAEGDGVRELYVGSLAHVHADLFPSCIDYLALGHLHSAQKVGGHAHMRYSGSPLPMSFGEADQEKEVICVEFIDKQIAIEGLKVPAFQALKRIRGDWEHIFAEVEKEKQSGSQAFLEVVYTGGEFVDLAMHHQLEKSVEGSALAILKFDNARKKERILSEGASCASLDDLQPLDVFKSMLEKESVPDNQHADLVARFCEMVMALNEEDLRQE